MTPADMPDLAKDIIGLIAGMDADELKLVVHYCERIIAQRKSADSIGSHFGKHFKHNTKDFPFTKQTKLDK